MSITIYVLSRNMNIRIFSENLYLLVVKFSVYLDRHVFVLTNKCIRTNAMKRSVGKIPGDRIGKKTTGRGRGVEGRGGGGQA